MVPEPLPSAAAAELDTLLSDPSLRRRWPHGFTSDDVLDELTLLGHVVVAVREAPPARVPPFTCRLELHEPGAGAVFGGGLSLTAAALRCLVEAEDEFAGEVQRGLADLADLLDDDDF